jgi:hypothetical protein
VGDGCVLIRIEKVAGSIPAGSTGFSQLKGWILTQGT